MAITVKHNKVSTIPDDADTSLVRPSDWNDDHVLTGTVPVANGGTGAATLTGYVKGNGTSTMTASSTIPNTDITGLGTASTKDAGVANGVATLDGSGTVPISQLPSAVLGALSYQGTWNASTNTPTLTSSVGTKGYYYVVSVAGSTNLNGITDWKVGDWAVYNGSAWQKIDNTDAVTSVNGYTGTVVLTNTDISGFGTMSTQNANSVAITGGTINGTTIGATTTSTGAFTTITASTSLTTPIVQATNSGGLSLKNSGGTTQMSVGAGGGDNMSINVSTNLNGTNAQIDISPTGTGHVHMKPTGTGSIEIAPTNVGTMDNMTIGATTPKAITGTIVTATTFSGSGASLTSIPNSALNNSAITINGTSTSLGGSISVGTVTSVTGTSPVVSSGGTTPAISMPAATTSVSGYLTSTDWNTFNNKGSGTVTSVSGTTGRITSTGGATPVIDLASGVATAGTTGSSTLIPVVTIDTYGRVTGITTASNPQGTVTSVTGTAPVVSSGGATPAISMAAATTSVNGYLTSTDWTTFNGKQAALVSGTNIKTINTNSILGSGDLTIAATPAGSTTQVQYNNAGALDASAGLAYNSTTSVLDVSASTGAIYPPSGTTAQRPASPSNGAMRFNTTTNQFEVYSGTAWVGLTTASYTVTYLSVAGGGGGGGNTAGGGGAGGFLTASLTFVPSTIYTITVGSGGSYGATIANGSNGNNSVISGSNITTVTSTGGGGGAGYAGSAVNGVAGGSGGGATGGGTGGSGTSGQGSAGGTSGGSGTTHAGGGGGGATSIGGTGTASTIGGAGGAGTASSITGSSVTYGGGGGGGVYGSSSQASGGSGGGGAGGAANIAGVNGTANTGGGGGGGGSNAIAGNGGSGVVILSMPTASYTGTTTGSPTVTTSGSNKILTFTSSGTYTA
jgi:hypothetical protein